MSAFEIWFLSRLCEFGYFLCGGGALAGIISLLLFCILKWDKDVSEDERRYIPLTKKIFIASVMAFCIGSLIPDRKTMLAMVIVPRITEQTWVNELPENSHKFINKLVKDFLGKDQK